MYKNVMVNVNILPTYYKTLNLTNVTHLRVKYKLTNP